MKITIRREHPKDYDSVFRVIERAFRDMKISDHTEQFLVKKLRKSEAFVPELSLVAEFDNQIVGHIILTEIRIINETDSVESLALAPVSVLPEFQRKGIGGLLIRKAHEIAQSLDFQSVILLGHAEYYPRFGYRKCRDFGIELPFEAPPENCMAIELFPNALKGVSGTVEYSKPFFE